MDKETIIERIHECGIIAVVRADNIEKAEEVTDACVEGGIRAIELTFTVPHADRLINSLCDKYRDSEVIIGAGTVMDSETARIALLAGAQFIVSPYFSEETVKLCNRYRIAVMPGVMTITEAVRAMEAGADILKVFPADLFGPKIIKAIKGPIPYAKMIPTGGVDANNVGEWLEAGAFAVGAGSSLCGGTVKKITETAKLFVDNVRRFRV